MTVIVHYCIVYLNEHTSFLMSIFGRSERSTDTSERVGLLLDKNAGAKKNGFGEKSKHTPKEAPFGRKAAVMAACLAQQFVCIGMGYGYSVMYAELVIALDVSRSVASLTAAFYFATVNIGGNVEAWFIVDMLVSRGYIKDATGTYNIAFYIAGAVCIYNGVTSVLASYYVRERNKMPRHDAGLTVKRETRQRLISSTRIHP
ncbi:hypothetical protein MAR_032524 [Mya arenaria]|uniref:Uncharacterized protein n=1 Tax=Mya arenaria TaxID=6604 RepID=A0ABY7F6W1_MYAAR|nr:hypothetical protein MAR_032524 [Mya arenaria]